MADPDGGGGGGGAGPIVISIVLSSSSSRFRRCHCCPEELDALVICCRAIGVYGSSCSDSVAGMNGAGGTIPIWPCDNNGVGGTIPWGPWGEDGGTAAGAWGTIGMPPPLGGGGGDGDGSNPFALPSLIAGEYGVGNRFPLGFGLRGRGVSSLAR